MLTWLMGAECGDFKKGAWEVVGGKLKRASDNVLLCGCTICRDHGVSAAQRVQLLQDPSSLPAFLAQHRSVALHA